MCLLRHCLRLQLIEKLPGWCGQAMCVDVQVHRRTRHACVSVHTCVPSMCACFCGP